MTGVNGSELVEVDEILLFDFPIAARFDLSFCFSWGLEPIVKLLIYYVHEISRENAKWDKIFDYVDLKQKP